VAQAKGGEMSAYFAFREKPKKTKKNQILLVFAFVGQSFFRTMRSKTPMGEEDQTDPVAVACGGGITSKRTFERGRGLCAAVCVEQRILNQGVFTVA